MRKIMIVAGMVLAVSFVLGFAVRAQDQASPGATPGTTLCATPVAQASASPEMVVPAPTTAADAGGSNPGTPIGLYPCATPTGGTTGGQTSGNAVTIAMVDIAFEPNVATISANTDVTVTLPNNGVSPHNFNIDQLGIKTEDVQPGNSTTVTINAPAGTYEFYCSIPGHKEAGMTGTITVQ